MAEDANNLDKEMRDLFGITEDTEEDTADTSTEKDDVITDENETLPQEDDATASQEDSEGSPEEQKEETSKQEFSKDKHPEQVEDLEVRYKERQNQAFAKLRVENKANADLIMQLARATGAEPVDLADAQSILKSGLTKIQSKQQNIPEDVLRRIEEQDKALASYKQEQARQRALSGFQQVKAMHGLSNAQVNEFVDKLIEKKINPFENPDVDLLKEYRSLYFEELIKAAREKGIQEERARSTKVKQSSTSPGTSRGLPEGTGGQDNPIKSVGDLDRFLSSLK